jgi:hypothetical protein
MVVAIFQRLDDRARRLDADGPLITAELIITGIAADIV